MCPEEEQAVLLEEGSVEHGEGDKGKMRQSSLGVGVQRQAKHTDYTWCCAAEHKD